VANIQSLTAAEAREVLDELTALLKDGIASGSALGFLTPIDDEALREYWRGVIAGVETRSRVLIVARVEGGALVGSAQLDLATSPNGQHRAEVQKVVVLRSARGQGVGQQLMLAIEDEARARGRTLLVLDTRKGNSAERLYQKLGYIEIGVIPDYGRTVSGTLAPSVFFYRKLT
jgi:acetyltransferase